MIATDHRSRRGRRAVTVAAVLVSLLIGGRADGAESDLSYQDRVALLHRTKRVFIVQNDKAEVEIAGEAKACVLSMLPIFLDISVCYPWWPGASWPRPEKSQTVPRFRFADGSTNTLFQVWFHGKESSPIVDTPSLRCAHQYNQIAYQSEYCDFLRHLAQGGAKSLSATPSLVQIQIRRALEFPVAQVSSVAFYLERPGRYGMSTFERKAGEPRILIEDVERIKEVLSKVSAADYSPDIGSCLGFRCVLFARDRGQTRMEVHEKGVRASGVPFKLPDPKVRVLRLMFDRATAAGEFKRIPK